MARGADLSAAEARRLALSSLGFGRTRPARAGIAHVRATAARLGAIQIDSVNVLARAHYLPTFSRYGPYPREALDRLAYDRRELFEYWGHAACYLPMDLYALLRWRMARQREGAARLRPRQREFHEAIYAEVAERGPIAASDISIAGRSRGSWWGWSDGKHAVEFLWRQGRIAIAQRRNFERLYDIAERVLPASVLDAEEMPPDDAKKALIVRAAGAMGVGTARDILQYFHIEGFWDRSRPNASRLRAPKHTFFDDLVEEGRLERVIVEGWREPGYMLPGARIPRRVDAHAIVSPFDPLLWERAWTHAVFGFEYQIEIYVPAHKRIHGYYVLPFLMGDRFAARVDLKADRQRSRLLVHAAHAEPCGEAAETAGALAECLRSILCWLELDRIAVGARGDLARALKKALGATSI